MPMLCPCVSELKRFLSGGSCTALMIYSFLHATGVSTSCAHYTPQLTYRTSRVTNVGCAAGSQRLGNLSSVSQAGIPHSGNTREQKSGRASLKIRFPMPQIGWHVIITRCYSDDSQQRSFFHRRPLRPRPGGAVSRRRRTEKRRQGRIRRAQAYLL